MADLGCAIQFYYDGERIGDLIDEMPGKIIYAFVFSTKAEKLDIPEGYTFEGWYTTETFEEDTKVTGDYIITQDTNFYANVVPHATVTSLLTNLANEIRELSGATDMLDLDEMASHVDDANDEIGVQNNLIAQVKAALEGKSMPDNVETFTLIVESDGVTRARQIEYTEFKNNKYFWHRDTLNNTTNDYPLCFENVVLKTPINIIVEGGANPVINRVSNFDFEKVQDYTYGVWFSIIEGTFFPTTTDDNGYVIVRCFDD